MRQNIPALIALLTLPALGASSVLRRLETSADLVRGKEYNKAIERTAPLVDQLKLTTVEEIILAHRLLGVAYCETGDQTKAHEHFQAVYAFSPTEEISDLVTTKPCAAMWEEVRGKIADSESAPKVSPSREIKESSVKSKDVAPKRAAVAATATPDTSHILDTPSSSKHWLVYVPLGSGHFHNGEPKIGQAFLATEGFAGALALTSFLLFKSEENGDGTFENSGTAETYKALFWSSVGIGTIAAAWDVIWAVRAHRHSRPAGTGNSVAFHF